MKNLQGRLPAILAAIALAAILAAAFMAYLRPSFMVELANQIILCM